ncbi:hypothetical protein XENOCAPTIV_003702 [Xenoophorus captivus]|uniref:adenylate cyclase n=1 Tax=Xenoophorus captivus TaxID=1517983 RepID=A0ABV0Q4E5_9TELE
MAVSYGVTFPVMVALLVIAFAAYMTKLHSKLPLNVQWVLKLSRNFTTRAVLRLLLVGLCVLITLLMAILNFVFLPGTNCTSVANKADLEGLRLYTVPDEMTCRVDFLLERCFQTEREEMETMENVNRLLLQNVMPLHVASFFMGKAVRNQDLYSESYDCVCVMFASMPQFKEFYSESSANGDGLECLRFLNEIIVDFDDVRPRR